MHMYGFITIITKGGACILNTNADDIYLFHSITIVYQLKVAIVGFYPFVDTTQGVSAITKQPLAVVSVPEGDCVSGNQAIRYVGFITFA